jgi:CHASE3 domain sensor protein
MAAADAGGVQGRWPIQLKVGLGFAAVTLVLLFNTVAFFIAQDRQETARSLTMRTFDVLGNLQALQIEALNQEAGLNSYQLTANSGDLRTYNQGKQAFTAIADQLRQLTKDLPRQQQRMATGKTKSPSRRGDARRIAARQRS